MLFRVQQIFLALTKTERVIFIIAFLALISSAVGLVAYFINSTTTVTPASGGEYTEGVVGQPSFINPVLASSPVDKAMVRLLFTDLTTLASSIDVENEGRTVRVRLKENLTWSDGSELTSDDVIFTVEQIQNPVTASPLFSAWQGVSADRGSKLEILFNLSAPYGLFQSHLNNLFPIPKHLYAEVPSPNWRLSEYTLRPISSGPYKISDQFKRADGFIVNYRLSKNQSYAGVEPLIPSFIVSFFANNTALIDAFNSGKIEGFLAPSPELIPEIRRPHIVTAFPSSIVYSIFLNQGQNIALRSEAVRRALQIGVNKATVTRVALGEFAIPAESPMPPALDSLNTGLSAPEYNPEEAIRLLESDGWEKGEDGIYQKNISRTSVPLSIEISTPDIDALAKAAEEVANQWRSLGVDAKAVLLPPDEILSSLIKNRNYQAVLFGNSIRKNGDLSAFWHSSERFHPGLNLALWDDGDTDELLEAIRFELDPEIRLALIHEVRDAIVANDPAVFLFSPLHPYVTRKDVHGINPTFLEDPADRFRQVSSWHLETARVFSQSGS